MFNDKFVGGVATTGGVRCSKCYMAGFGDNGLLDTVTILILHDWQIIIQVLTNILEFYELFNRATRVICP
jgi:hypothetical protein